MQSAGADAEDVSDGAFFVLGSGRYNCESLISASFIRWR